jgi:hypothetical protein
MGSSSFSGRQSAKDAAAKFVWILPLGPERTTVVGFCHVNTCLRHNNICFSLFPASIVILISEGNNGNKLGGMVARLFLTHIIIIIDALVRVV